MSEEQRELARDRTKSSEIAELLGRDTSTMTRGLCMQKQPKKQGRPKALTTAQGDLLERQSGELIAKVDGTTTITVETWKKATKSKASTHLACAAQAEHGRKLSEKPVPTPADIRDRFAFAKKYCGKSKRWWLSNVHAACIHRREALSGLSDWSWTRACRQARHVWCLSPPWTRFVQRLCEAQGGQSPAQYRSQGCLAAHLRPGSRWAMEWQLGDRLVQDTCQRLS